MLYNDYRLEVPDKLPDPSYSIRLQQYKNGSARTVVLHTGPSKRDPVTHKLIHAKRVTIGKAFDENGNTFFVPNEHYFEYFAEGKMPPAMSKVTGSGRPPKTDKNTGYAALKDGHTLAFGYALAWIHMADELGLRKILTAVFGFDQAMQILTVAAFYAFDKERGLTLLEKFSSTQMSFTEKRLNSQRACELFASIEESELADFFHAWLEHRCGPDYCFYDVTSISYTGDGITEVAWGYNRDHEDLPQVNLGLFVSSSTGLPLFYCNYNGGINDFTNFPYVMSEAQFMGLKGRITIVGDRIFSDPNSASKVYNMGYGLLVGIQMGRNSEAKDRVLAWQKDQKLFIDIGDSTVDGMACSSCDFTLKDIPGKLFMYKQDDTFSLEWSAVQATIKQIRALVKDGKNTMLKPPSKLKKLCDVEAVIAPDGSTEYRLIPSESKAQDAKDLCGCFAIFTTEGITDPFECLELYRAKDICEKNFANLKNDLIGERMLVHSSRAWHGKLFILFISLIIRTALHNKLKPWIAKHRSSLKYAFVTLSEIKCRKNGDRWLLKEAITKEQQELAKELELPLDYLKNSILV